MKYRFLLALLSIGAINFAFASQCNMPNDWDWTKESAFADSSSFYPFYEGNYIGATLKHFHCPEDGWLLYAKRLTCQDIHDSNSACENPFKSPYVPYFALYNKYTGLLRFFIWIPREHNTSTENKDSLDIVLNIVRYNNPNDESALLINSENPARSLEELNDSTQEITYHIPSSEKNVWAVADYYVTYPGENLADNLAFRIGIYANNSQDISLSGEIKGRLSDITKGRSASGFSIVKGIYDDRDTIKDAFDGGKDLHKDIAGASKDLINSNNDILMSIGWDLGDLSSWMSENSNLIGGIGAAEAAFRVVGGLMGSKDSVHHQYIDLDINLNGNVTDTTSALKHLNVAVHGSQQYNQGLKGPDTEDLNLDGNMGVFNFKSQPSFVIRPNEEGSKHEYSGYFLEDIKDLINLNPALRNELTIETVAIQPEFDMEISMYDRGFVSARNYNHTSKRLLHSTEAVESRNSIAYATEQLSKKKRRITVGHNQFGSFDQRFMSYAKEMDSASLRSPVGLGSTAVFYGHKRSKNDTREFEKYRYLLNNVNIKVFIKFRHKFKDDVYFDYVGYLTPDVKVCGMTQRDINKKLFTDEFDKSRIELVGNRECNSLDTPYSVKVGQEIKVGESIYSQSKTYFFRLEPFGQLVLYNKYGHDIAYSERDSRIKSAKLDSDGLIKLYDSNKRLVSSFGVKTGTGSADKMVVSDQGVLSVQDSAGTQLWSTDDFYLEYPGKLIHNRKSTIYSPNGQFKLLMQSDGNLVVYNHYGSADSASGTGMVGRNAFVRLSNQGHLEIYDNNTRKVAWRSNGQPSNKRSYVLRLQNDGRLKVSTGFAHFEQVLWVGKLN
ncbi:hypothetical protein GCM10011297_35150 [Bacterioplanes sanyensis]|uniref:hypothetical protein n=1 Tax=Bacterioplanes sanyensis TaxID=1249553 RepID=UPI0016752B3F|nr:hypothetical protein [Bacterioplanes sanyensis]GGY59617.1 hypothetical protein GCM10011297_35150 [Bacterioplanes sanyensis]